MPLHFVSITKFASLLSVTLKLKYYKNVSRYLVEYLKYVNQNSKGLKFLGL